MKEVQPILIEDGDTINAAITKLSMALFVANTPGNNPGAAEWEALTVEQRHGWYDAAHVALAGVLADTESWGVVLKAIKRGAEHPLLAVGFRFLTIENIREAEKANADVDVRVDASSDGQEPAWAALGSRFQQSEPAAPGGAGSGGPSD